VLSDKWLRKFIAIKKIIIPFFKLVFSILKIKELKSKKIGTNTNIIYLGKIIGLNT